LRKRNPTDLNTAEAFRIPDAARLYSVGANVFFDAIRRGELEASKLGDSPRSPVIATRAAIERYLAARRIRPQTESEAA
jgi:hypothetical protein